MTNKWTVNGVEAPEGAEFIHNINKKRYRLACGKLFVESDHYGKPVWALSNLTPADLRDDDLFSFYMPAPNAIGDYAFCLSEAINKLKHCADVAPDDKRKDALLEIVDEVEFIKSEGEK